MVVKKDGSRERSSARSSRRPAARRARSGRSALQQLEAIADRVEPTLQDRPEREMTTEEIGAFVMHELKQLDKVAYVRFASVYRQFRDIGEFKRELKELLNARVEPTG